MLSQPKRLLLKSEKSGCELIVLELNEDRALEELLIGAAKANLVEGTVRREEGFDVELRARLFIAEALCIDWTRLGLGSRNGRIIWNSTLDFFETLWTSNLEELTISESGDDSRDWLEALHTLEFANLGNLDRAVLGAIGEVPQVGVSR